MSTIEHNVMASVRVIYASRLLTTRMALECYALLLSSIGIIMFVSLPHVFENLLSVASQGEAGILPFLVSAVVGTKVLVQLALLVGAGALSLLIADIIRSIQQSLPRAGKSSLA